MTQCNYPNCDGGQATGYCHFDCRSKERDNPTTALLAIIDDNERLRATLLNIQSLAERGFPLDHGKIAEQCRRALCAGKKG